MDEKFYFKNKIISSEKIGKLHQNCALGMVKSSWKCRRR